MTNRPERRPERLPRRLGAYELTERVGEGGMGVVYKAIDKRLGTAAAVKVIHEHLRDEPGYLERFRREAHVASLLTSPYIVHVIEFGFDKNTYYLATEYVTGTRLAEVIEKGPMDPERALGVAVQVTLALAEADVRGVIHCEPPPPVTAASYSVFGFSDSATAGSDPPASTVGSGATLRSCNPGALYAWIDYANAPTPASFTGRWFRGSNVINETSFTQTVPAGRMFWSVGAPLPPDTYGFEVLQGGTRVTGGSVTLAC